MNILLEFECDLKELNNFSKKLAKQTEFGDIFFLKGDLGVGKTTFARSFINSLCDRYQVKRPENIKSPSYPIMINYPLLTNEIYHYDFYRLTNKNELSEIGLFEELEKNILIIEWPDIILNNFDLSKYYLLQFEFVDYNKRLIKILHSKNKQF